MALILIIEDEPAIADLIEMNLQLVGHETKQAGDEKAALEKLAEHVFDLILLDIMLPGHDGFTIMEKIKHLGCPVIFLTARNAVSDKVKGLRLGADDYITKPFEAAELLARIEAVLRRTGRDHVAAFSLCGAEIDLAQRNILVNGMAVSLTAQEFNLLEVLIKNRNIAMSREKLLEAAWGYDYAGETRTVDMHIQRLRKKLDWDNCLKTVYKYGYRLETDA